MAGIGDVVLVHHKEEPTFFARIEDIEADHKPGWYHVHLLVLAVPLAEVTWILKEEYINGESFTMGGESMRLEKVVRPEKKSVDEAGDLKEEAPPRDGNVVSLFDRKK